MKPFACFLACSIVVIAAVLSGCQPASPRADGVELVMGSETPTPGMTFELRFETPMVKASEIGAAAPHSPLLIRPRLAGTFTWLSPRNGVFTPDEPLALDTTYELSLRPGLPLATGQPARASLRWTVTTPPFGLQGSFPSQPNTNAPSESEFKLLFNADARAADVGRFLHFQNSAGLRIPAAVRQGTEEDAPRWYEFGNAGSRRTWAQEFAPASRAGDLHARRRSGPEPSNEFANLLIVSPQPALPLGKDWRLVLDAGLPARDGPYRFRAAASAPVGDVTPFVVSAVTTENYLNSGPGVRIDFSKPVPESLTNEFAKWLELTPSPSNLVAQVNDRTLVLRGNFTGDTSYSLVLRAGFPADEPFTLTGSNTFALRMPSVPPRLYFPAWSRDQLAGGNRTFPLMSVNVPKARVRAKLMDAPTAIHALRGYQSYFRSWREQRDKGDSYEPYRSVNYNLVPGRTVFNEELDLNPERDAAKTVELAWDRMLAGRKTGVVFLEAERVMGENDGEPALGTQALIQLTDLGMIWKRSKEAVGVFVFSHRTGNAVAGATARLFSDENEPLREAVTDGRGWARLNADTNASWIAVQSGEDFHALALQENRVWLYGFDLPFAGWNENENPRRVMLFSDRNLYRPGEEVHLEAWARDWSGSGLTAPAMLTGVLECTDARQRKFWETNVVFSPSGGYSGLIPLPAASLGGYTAKLRFGTNTAEAGQNPRFPEEFTHAFQMQDFQPSAFEISLAAKSAFGAGEKIEVPVSARYLFGKALSHAQVKWSLEAGDFDFKPKGFENFNFRRVEIDSRRGPGNAPVALSGQGMLSGSSNFVIAPGLSGQLVSPQPRIASLLVEVTDVNQQTLSRQAEFVRHSSAFYLGLSAGTEVLTEGKPLPLEVLAMRADGQPWSETIKVQLTLQHIEWQSVRIQGAGRTVRYHNEAVLTNVFDAQVEVQPVQMPAPGTNKVAGQLVTGLPTLKAGQYLAEIKTADAAGRPVISSVTFSVSSPESLGWNYLNEVQLALKHDHDVYAPGETAEILVEAPFSGTALVTVEREKVLRSFVTRLEGNAPSIRVPLEPGDVPNVFVSVTLVRGSDDSPHKVKEPEYRIGYCELPVANPQNRLGVTVSPGATNYLPGQTVEVSAQVTDVAGRGVSGAHVVLYAVDDGIVSLTDYGLPDPYGFFYAARPLGVQSSVSLPNLLTEDSEQRRFENKGYLGGGGGRDRVRKNFLACAFWNAALTTDAGGKVAAKFPAPDSLTRYRVFAVVCSGDHRFGSGQSAFQVSKPLVIEPALPAFASISDHLLARGLIQNQTTNRGEVIVTLELDDHAKPDAGGSLTRRIPITANGSAVVEFPLELTEAGGAKWLWRARFADASPGGFTDAVESRIEVGHVAPLLREVLLSRSTSSGSATNLLAVANPQLLAGSGVVTVNIANTRLGELGEAVSQLLHYPYGCVEQTGSSLLPWILLREETSLRPRLDRAVRDLAATGRGSAPTGLSSSTSNEITAVIRAGVARLFTMQTASGGLGYWPGAKEPMLWASGYGGMVLALAEKHGAKVPKEEFRSLLKYLSQQLRTTAMENGDLSDHCLALYALALAGEAEPAYHDKLYELRGKLSTEDRALLALAIAESSGPSDMIAQLLEPDAARRAGNEERFGCAARAQAIGLLAWTRHAPESPIVDRLVNELMGEQKQAHWGTTQGDAWALLALSEYARRVEGGIRPASGRLITGDESIAFQLTGPTNLFLQTFSMTNVANGALNLINDLGSPLYATVTIEARPPETPQPRQNRGFSLQRRYERLDDENHPHDLRGLRVGDRVLVTLNLNVREPARYVAIDDALPAILEAVNPEFKTRAARGAGGDPDDDNSWPGDFHELRKDRCLSFADWLGAGDYTWRYVARVRAAGTVTAPSAKVEAMYQPDRYGLSGTQVIASEGLAQ